MRQDIYRGVTISFDYPNGSILAITLHSLHSLFCYHTATFPQQIPTLYRGSNEEQLVSRMPKNNKKSKGKTKAQGGAEALSSPVLAKRSGASDLDRDDSDPAEQAVQHEDPFGDEFEDEQVLEDDDDNGMEDDQADGVGGGGGGSSSSAAAGGAEMAAVRPWFKPGVDKLGEDEELVMDPAAYIMHHALNAEWPALSFDVLKDDLGGNRTKFPLTVFAVAGSQVRMQLADLTCIHRRQPVH